ncbi:hypothetical protein [Flavobacterium collinsii]|uniref:Uncharacterized protein n=1 Tax=Flavobacterium collinsii TaxID=1114861 RepID=A0A9W4TK24_9FLAO|nr:hypothetical protein [Flavobacterium collinsii]CAA9201529.1 hypothetical protein FLACOL7796_03807 [Flavobacterium collinsii]CAI2768336.1 conserved exported protein of unknown function [Flavobacterium collinsii]
MKITLRTVLYLLLCAFQMNGQTTNHGMNFSVFNDTENLLNSPVTTAKQVEILSHYFKNKAEIDNFNSLYNFSLPNPDFATFLIMDNSNSIQGLFSSSAISQSAGVDALGTFIANRFKQEINIAFLNKFKEDLETIPFLKEIFPTSYQVLQKSDPYNYPVFINSLREAFDNDLNNFSKNLPLIVSKLNITDVNIKSRLIVIATLMDIKNISNLPGSISNLIENNQTKSNMNILTKDLKILALGINMFKKNGVGLGSFMNNVDLAKLSNPEFAKIYLALLVRQNEKYIEDLSIQKADTGKLLNIVQSLQTEYEALANEINRIITNNKNNKLSLSDIQKSTEVMLGSFENTIDVFEKNSNIKVSTELKDAILKGKEVNVIVGFIADKKYGLALINLTDFIFTIDQTTLTAEQKTMIKKYTSFIANCLDAKTKDELIAALETSANPVGSYRIKRNSTFNISLNAYAGGFAGTNFEKTQIFGFTAPAGIYLGWGNLGKEPCKGSTDKSTILEKVNGKSFGIFVSLIDVGAVTAFRLKDSKTEMADVSWDNVFAPGAYLTYGFGKCPISLNLGGQMGPELKSIAEDGTPNFVEKEWFWRASIVIDISLFDFYTNQKAYKTLTR